MENFNAKEYRDNLAKNLKDTRKTDPEKAQEVLEEAQQTEEYQEAKRAHQENREQKEKLGELDYVPIFRGNALYNAIFPDVEPLFQAGEEPDVKVILQEILNNEGKKIVFDKTTKAELFYKMKEEDLLEVLPSLKIEYNESNNKLSVRKTLLPVLKEKNITLENNEIEEILRNKESNAFFSKEDAKEIVFLVKNQVPDVNRVIIAISQIADHVFKVAEDRCVKNKMKELYPDNHEEKEMEIKSQWKQIVKDKSIQENLQKLDKIMEDTKKVKFLRSDEAKKSFESGFFQSNQIEIEKEMMAVIATYLGQEIENSLDIRAEFVAQDIDLSTIDEKTVIIYDRHNDLSYKKKLEKEIPQQTVFLPTESAIQHAQEIGALKTIGEDYAMHLRKRFFEKKRKSVM